MNENEKATRRTMYISTLLYVQRVYRVVCRISDSVRRDFMFVIFITNLYQYVWFSHASAQFLCTFMYIYVH